MYRPGDSSPAAGQQTHIPRLRGAPPFAFSSAMFGIDPSLNNSSQHLHPAARPAPSRMSSHTRHSSLEVASAMHERRSASPRLSHPPTSNPFFKPADRHLPDRDVTAESITDAFVDFILYCNPNFALDVDTTTLRTNFQNPPKSDNKDFETFRLFELIGKFDAKEIKTWGQLALDLGVEAPDTSKGQSVQKVQQYSVRLKRWMRAMHIDAFFEYLLGKPHAYFTEVPYPNDPYPSAGRDGVAAEEDLAIRALDPTFRPKRGRRRNSEVEQEEIASSAHPGQQPPGTDHLASHHPHSAIPHSAVPLSSHPDSFHDPWTAASAITPQSFAPWSSRSAAPLSSVPGATPSNLRWQASQTPGTPHPMNGLSTSMAAHIETAFDGEPKSAVTPSSNRKRRRHGPAVSSAWPSANGPGAKPRGRPPANRNVQDGPYNTFPVDPTSDKLSAPSHLPTPLSGDKQVGFDPPSPPVTSAHSDGRPGRLSLQVPPHTGGPVRLATPPRVLVNGETNDSESRSDSDAVLHIAKTSQHSGPHPGPRGGSSLVPRLSSETFRRVLASDLLRADLVGRGRRLTGDEAKRLADAAMERLGLSRGDADDPQDDIARLTAASWFGLGTQLNIPPGPATGHGKRISVTRFRTDADGYEEITYDDGTEDVREVFDLLWNASCGGCMGTFEMKGLTLGAYSPPGETLHDLTIRRSLEATRKISDEPWLQQVLREVAMRAATGRARPGEENIDWKARCLSMEFSASIAKGEVDRLKERILQQILDTLL